MSNGSHSIEPILSVLMLCIFMAGIAITVTAYYRLIKTNLKHTIVVMTFGIVIASAGFGVFYQDSPLFALAYVNSDKVTHMIDDTHYIDYFVPDGTVVTDTSPNSRHLILNIEATHSDKIMVVYPPIVIRDNGYEQGYGFTIENKHDLYEEQELGNNSFRVYVNDTTATYEQTTTPDYFILEIPFEKGISKIVVSPSSHGGGCAPFPVDSTIDNWERENQLP